MPEFLLSMDPFWFWLCAGFVLLALEVLVGGSAFFLCISTAAFIPALIALAHPGLSWLWSFTLFACLLLPASLVWRRFIRSGQDAKQGEILNERGQRLVGSVLILDEDSVDLKGRVRVDGSSWPYECAQGLRKGDRVKVVGSRGIVLQVEKYPAED
ncbi:MAG: NfeD family protein [Desulfovibrio sp.]|jgi:membrane protein implicated in regulation of membrane protease activity|nr:NfeD family protein [Desulfovibrio sp.]